MARRSKRSKRSPKIPSRDRILTAIKDLIDASDTLPWHKPWTLGSAHLASNASTGKIYQGLNQLILGSDGHYAGYGQWAKLGCSVKKGERGTLISCPIPQTRKSEGGEDESYVVFGHAHVFSSEQIDGDWTPESVPYEPPPITTAESVVAGMQRRPPIHHGGNRAWYSPGLDRVQIPPRGSFETREAYYQTVSHELAHSTLHKDRLDRAAPVDLSRDHSYAREELVAELAACYLAGPMGIEPDLNQSASYISGWLKRISDDPSILLEASRDASHAADFIIGKRAPKHG